MGRLERRVAALERRAQGAAPRLLDILLRILGHGADWYPDLAAAASAPRDKLDAVTLWIIEFLEKRGNNDGGRFRRLPRALDRGLADVLFMDIGDPDRSVFDLERLRGIVSDEILASVYDQCRNYAWPPDIALRVRQLAGVVDENGQVAPGYVLCDNGCIIEAKR